jgi:hypothetical protein
MPFVNRSGLSHSGKYGSHADAPLLDGRGGPTERRVAVHDHLANVVEQLVGDFLAARAA